MSPARPPARARLDGLEVGSMRTRARGMIGRRRTAAVLAVAALALGACETGQVDRDRFDAMVAERDDATRRLVEAVTESEVLRDTNEQLRTALDELQAANPVVDLDFWNAFVEEWDVAWTTADIDRIMALYADDAVVEIAVEGIIRRGAPDVRELHQEFLDRYQRLVIETEEFEARPERAVLLWEGSAIRVDGSFELLAGGTLIEIVDGLIVRQVDYAVFN